MFNVFLCFFLQFGRAELRYSFESYIYGQKSETAESAINPQNAILKLDSEKFVVDLRGELKWRTESDLFVVRPRLTAIANNTEIAAQTEQEFETDSDLTDAFHERNWSDNLSSTVGLQVYQWGPAEFLNPSNPFYHFSSQQRTIIHKEKGKVLLRLNYSPSKIESLVFVIEPVSNNEVEWIGEDKFVPKYALKYEKVLNDNSDYAGLAVGTGEKNTFFVGEYFSYAPIEGLSFYGDAKHSSRKTNFTPEFNGIGYDMVASSYDVWPTLAILGARWESDIDLRLEYIHNSAGYNRSELNAAVSAAGNFLNPLFAQNLSRFLRPGLELPGRNYAYLSLRIADPLNSKELNFYSRLIWSLQDESHLTQLEVDKVIEEDYLIFSNFNFSNGESDSEFRLLNAWQFLFGLKWGL